MNPGGWFLMITSVGCVLILVIFCFYRVLSLPDSTDHMQDPLEVNTHDKDT